MSFTGLKNINSSEINLDGPLRLTSDLGAGTSGQVITSQGETLSATWANPTATAVPNPLTMGTNVSLSSGNATWDGSIADTLNSTDTDTQLNLTGGNGISVANTGGLNRTITTDNDGTTINNTGGTGAQNQVLKVPNALTINGTTYDGSVARAFTLPVAPIPNADLQNSSLTLGNTTCTLGTTTSTIEELELDACLGITMDGANIDLDGGDVVGIDDLTFQSSAGASAMTGNAGAGGPTTMTNFDLTASTNIIHPPNVFDVAGDLRMSLEMGNFYPNDDSSFFQIGVEDDLSTKIHGSIKVLTSSLEVCGYFIIPQNYTATAVRIDVVGSTGASVSRTITIDSVNTYGGVGFTAIGSITSNSEQTLTTTMTGASDRIMLITIKTTSTTDHIRGGYIKLTR